MIIFEKCEYRNFLSTGNTPTTIQLNKYSTTLVTGENGSGKSTLMALLGGLDTPSTGTVSVYGQKLNGMDPVDLAAYRRSTVGFVFRISFY